MGFFIVTIKRLNNGFHNPHAKQIGSCDTSPMCTDSTGAHHSFVAKAEDMTVILARAIQDGVHVTRIEEIFHVTDYEDHSDASVSVRVRDAASDRDLIPSAGTIVNVTEFDLASVPGFSSIDRKFFPQRGGKDAGGRDGAVPRADREGSEEIIRDIREAPYPEELGRIADIQGDNAVHHRPL